MANDYYNATEIVPLTRGRSRVRNDEFNAVEDGFDKLPSLAAVFGGLATFAGDSTGAGNAYAVTMPKTRTANADGEEVVFIANHTNTGAATLNVDGIGAVSIIDANGDALTAGVIESGLVYEVRYDATNTRFQMVGPGGDLAFLDTVDTAQIEDSAVTTLKINDLAVTTAKINDLAVTTAKLASNAVTTAKITDLNVTTGKLADLAVTAAKLASNAVETAKILDDNVTSDKLAHDLTLVGDVTVDTGGVILDAGEGIDFSANTGTAASGATTTSELLAFYEEGTWTPSVQDASQSDAEGQGYDVRNGRFTRIGRMVFFQFHVDLNSVGTLSGQAFVAGLPYPCNALIPGSGVAPTVSNVDAALSGETITAQVFISSSRMGLRHGVGNIVTVEELTDNGAFTIVGQYQA